jgi:hypothetical protein
VPPVETQPPAAPLAPGTGGEGPPRHPIPIAPADAALSEASQIRHDLDLLLQWERDRQTPPVLRPITFNGASSPPIYEHRDTFGGTSLSVGIANPSAVQIYLGLTGGKAGPNQHAFVVPAKSVMVIPAKVDDVRLGVDPAELLATEAFAFLMRFQTVQALFLAKM